jgi:hypothetical protein
MNNSDSSREKEAAWLRAAADLEEEAGGFPLETGVILNAVRPKPSLSPIRERLAELDPNLLFADGWDGQILGTAHSPGRELLVVYDGDAIVNVMINRDGMSPEEAEEFFSFNVEGAWVGERTPVFVRR